MFVLVLNPMRGQVERGVPVARAETIAALEEFIKRETVEPYKDGQWHKVFRAGGPLEWYNPPSDGFFFENFQDIGTEETWAENARKQFRQMMAELQAV